MVPVLIILLIISLAGIAVLLWRDYQRVDQLGKINHLKSTLETISQQTSEAKKIRDNLITTAESLKETISVLHHEEAVAQVKRNTAIELAEKDLALEIERRRADFEQKLADEFDELRARSSVTAYQRLLEGLNSQIEEARQTLKVQ